MPPLPEQSTALQQACQNIADGQPARIVQLQRLCAQNSGSWNTAGLAALADSLLELFSPLADTVERLPLPPVRSLRRDGHFDEKPLGELLCFRRRPHAPLQILLVGHYDTVFGAEHAFQQGRMLDANRLNAPGAADLKGGLLVMQAALAAFENLPGRAQLGWTVLLNPDEEIGSPGSAPWLAHYAALADIGLCYEPSLPSGELAGARKGSGNFSVHIQGRAAHAGRAHAEGRNAITAMAEVVAALDALNGQHGDMTVNVGAIEGGGSVNVVPDHCLMRVNVRVSQDEQMHTVTTLLKALRTRINARDGFCMTVDGGFHRPPKPMTPTLETLFELLRSVGRQIGLELTWSATGGCCDGNNLAAAGLPNIDTLGVRGAHIHSAEEFCLLDSMTERAQLSLLLLDTLARATPESLKRSPQRTAP